ncbi:MAG: (Fe-S)-binding protein [Candidatus Rehaiarchaeum fermentans]|nr:(Fe-S)-binding protein [Candidatus Rehaiarchaeum fermentans]
MEGERSSNACGGFKVKGSRVQIDRKIVSRVFDELSPEDVHGLENCMRCNVCSFTCPFWIESRSKFDVPSWRTYEINKIYSMYYTGYGIVARYLRLRKLKSTDFSKWTESAYNCTACGACTITSPMEIPNWYTALLMRRVLHYTGFNLEGAEKLAKNTRETGNALGITKDEWINIANQAGLRSAKIADVLYVPSALEVKYKDVLSNMAQLFDKMKINYTISQEISDVGYYSYFAGDFETARKMFTKVYEEAKKVNAKKIVVSDGTAYFMLRWQGPKSLRYKLDIDVQHITMLAYERKGNLKLEKVDIPSPVTAHYSEFLSRMSKVEKPPREILKLISPQFNDYKGSPSSDKLFTCGHHLELIPEKSEVVKKIRKYSVDQILKLGGKSVVTFDPNCRLSLENAVKDGLAKFNVIDFTDILNRGLKA